MIGQVEVESLRARPDRPGSRLDRADFEAGRLLDRFQRKFIAVEVDVTGGPHPDRRDFSGAVAQRAPFFAGQRDGVAVDVQLAVTGLAGNDVVEEPDAGSAAGAGHAVAHRADAALKGVTRFVRRNDEIGVLFVENQRHVGAVGFRIVQNGGFDPVCEGLFLPERGIVPHAARMVVVPPDAVVAREVEQEVAPQQQAGLFEGAVEGGAVAAVLGHALAHGNMGRGVVLVEPDFARRRDAFADGVGELRAARHPGEVGVAVRAAEHVDVGGAQQPGEREVSRLRGAVALRHTLEKIAVEDRDDAGFAALLAHDARQLQCEVRHVAVQERIEIDARLFGVRVVEHLALASAAERRRRNRRVFKREVVLLPRPAQGGQVVAVLLLQEVAEGRAGRVVVAEQVAPPREVAVLEFAVVSGGDVVAHHVIAVLALHIADEVAQRPGGFAAVARGGDRNLIPAAVGGEILFPHIRLGERRFLKLDAGHEKGVGIRFQDFRADVVGEIGGGFPLRFAAPQRQEADRIDPDAVFPGQLDFGGDAFRFHRIAFGDPRGGKEEVAFGLAVARQPRHAVDRADAPVVGVQRRGNGQQQRRQERESVHLQTCLLVVEGDSRDTICCRCRPSDNRPGEHIPVPIHVRKRFSRGRRKKPLSPCRDGVA